MGDDEQHRDRERTQKTSEAGVRFFQRRVALFGLVGAGLGGIFLAFRAVTLVLLGTPELLIERTMVLHLIGASALLASWVLCRGAPRDKKLVESVEAISITVSAVAYSAMGAYLPPMIRPEMVMVMAMTMAVMARAVFVPSTHLRTGLLSAALGVPVVLTGYYVHATGEPNPLYPPIAVAISTAVWWSLSVTLATLTSRVIYGLRKEIREARRLGQYALERKLGEGGMGVVYQASHAMLRRPTAIKLLPANKAGEQTIARFEREVRLTARLTHPNTVTIFDYGRTPDGIFYYAMELLDGATLEEIVEHDGAQPASRVLHVLAAMAGALSEAHAIGLIHRDIKPANVMLCRRGVEVDVPKLLDFGLVKDLEGAHTLSLTSTNTITGTPLYMPPEAIVSPDKVDGRSDLYALAAVGYYMLTGTHVFEGDSVVEVCSRHLQTAPEPPSERLRQPVPEDLSDILLACLAKDPKQRPATAAELQARLLACHDAHAWMPEHARSWWEEHGAELSQKLSQRHGSSSEKSIAVDLGRKTGRPSAAQ